MTVLMIYRDIEDWIGLPDAHCRAHGGLFPVAPSQHPHPIATAMLRGVAKAGLPTFAAQNGVMIEG